MTAQLLLTAAQVGRRLWLTAGTVKQWAREGRVPSIRATGKTIRFDWDHVVATLKAEGARSTPANTEVQ